MRSMQQPRPVGQDLVNIVKVAQLLRDALEASQPVLVAALKQEFLLLKRYQVAALVSAGSLEKSNFFAQNQHANKFSLRHVSDLVSGKIGLTRVTLYH